jgi:hypothetical protein
MSAYNTTHNTALTTANISTVIPTIRSTLCNSFWTTVDAA